MSLGNTWTSCAPARLAGRFGPSLNISRGRQLRAFMEGT